MIGLAGASNPEGAFYRQAFRVGALAGASLLLEGSLTRLLAVAQFYHFAFLVVSLALLGFGASGSLLTTFPGLAAPAMLMLWRIILSASTPAQRSTPLSPSTRQRWTS